MESEGPVLAAGVIARSPQGRVLLCKRTDGEGWAWPGGGIKDGETAEKAAWREFFEETGFRLGDVGSLLMRRVKDGCDFTTFIADVESEFSPTLNHEHSCYGWFDPKEALAEATVSDDADEPQIERFEQEIEALEQAFDDCMDKIEARLQGVESRLT